jgi:hypothetical protein
LVSKATTILPYASETLNKAIVYETMNARIDSVVVVFDAQIA